jgi:hypothetical protein
MGKDAGSEYISPIEYKHFKSSQHLILFLLNYNYYKPFVRACVVSTVRQL